MKWEYKIETLASEPMTGQITYTQDSEALLNELGRDGWELVSVMLPIHSHAALAFLKRPF